MSLALEKEAAFESGIAGFLYRQFFRHPRPIPPGTNLDGQTAIVTGSNVGLGFESARQLLQLGLSTLIIAVRSFSKGEDAAKGLRAQYPRARIEVWAFDMASYDSVQAFATRCQTLDRIDIVILNAGLMMPDFVRVEATGHEQTLQVNYLSTALLTILLLPILKAKRKSLPSSTKPPVLGIVTSDTAHWLKPTTTGPTLATADREEGYNAGTQYQRSKLFEMLFVIKLAELVNADDVIVNLPNPGFTGGTTFDRGDTMGVLFAVFRRIVGRSLQSGASTYVDATVLRGRESHGCLCSDWDIRPFPSIVYTEEGKAMKERLWEETMEEFGFAGASKIVQDLRR